MNKPLGFGQLSMNAVKQLSDLAAGIPPKSVFALIEAENGNVRWRDDGMAPTGDVGMLLQNGQVLFYDAKLTNIQLIKQTGAPITTIVNVSFYRTE